MMLPPMAPESQLWRSGGSGRDLPRAGMGRMPHPPSAARCSAIPDPQTLDSAIPWLDLHRLRLA